MFRGKKAQVSLFILIGIVVLIGVMVFLYIQTTLTEEEIAPEIKRAEEIPSELLPVTNYVENCIKIKAKQGLKLLGEHGGYTHFETFTPNYAEPTEGDALEYLPGTNFLVPYWYYMKSDNDCQANCVFESRMPMLCRTGRDCITNGDNSIEEQLDRYINDEIKSCLMEFSSLREQGYEIIETGDIETNTVIANNYVNFNVKYPLEIKRGEVVQKINMFRTSLKSDLTEVYELAYDITNYESEKCFVGKHVTNYYSAFYGLDEGQLPPEYEMTIGLSNPLRIWTLGEVEGNLKAKTRSAVDVIGIFNQSGFVWPEADPNDPYYNTKQGILDQYVFYPLRKYYDASVSLKYNPWWTPYLDVRPREGRVLMPTNLEGAGGLAAIFSSLTKTRIYEFSYQYSFPVVVEIRKKNEFGEQLFRFALESNIRANRCFSPEITLRHNAPVFQSNLCEDSERTEELILRIRDESNSELLSDVGVSFYAGDTCLLGTTNSDGVLTTKYPETFGRGSMIILKKDNYLTRFISVPDLTANFETRLKPERNKNISLKLIDMESLNQMASATSMSNAMAIRDSNLKAPNEDELIMIQLNRIKDNYQDDESSTFTYFDGSKFIPETVEILPGKYNVSVQLFANQEMIIPEENDRICEAGLENFGRCIKTPVSSTCQPRGDSKSDFEEGDCYIGGYTCESTVNAIAKNSGAVSSGWKTACTIAAALLPAWCGLKGCVVDQKIVLPEMKLSILPNGGVVYDNWDLTDYNYLNAEDKLTIYLFRQDIPTRHSHLNEMNKFEEYSETYRYALEPEIR